MKNHFRLLLLLVLSFLGPVQPGMSVSARNKAAPNDPEKMAIANSTLAAACPAILRGLRELTAMNGEMGTAPVGFLQALRTPRNIGTFDNAITPLSSPSGKNRQVRVAYKQRALRSSITSVKDCLPVAERDYLEEIVNVTLESHHTITLSEEKIRTLCEDWQRFVTGGGLQGRGSISQYPILVEIANLIAMDMPAIREDINIKLQSLVPLSAIGRWQGAVTNAALTFNMLAAGRQTLRADGLNDFRKELMKMGASGQPLVVGANNIQDVTYLGGAACCNDLGIDLGRLAANSLGFDTYLDYQMATTLGNANAVLAWLPTALQMISYNRYRPFPDLPFSSEINGKYRGVIPDPALPGMFYDMSIQADNCLEAYTVKLDAYYDLWRAPLNMFAVGDRMEGVNGVVRGIVAAA